MFEKLGIEDQTTLSPINDTGGAYSMVKKEFPKYVVSLHDFKVCTNTCIYPVPRYKDILIIECSSSDLQDISPTCLSRILTLKTMIKRY